MAGAPLTNIQGKECVVRPTGGNDKHQLAPIVGDVGDFPMDETAEDVVVAN